MLPGTYDLSDHYAGDTFLGLSLTLTTTENDVTSPIDLTGAAIVLNLNYRAKTGQEVLNLSVGNGITVTDASAGQFKIDPFQVPDSAGVYYYAITVTFADSTVKTYIEGTMKVVQRVV